MKFFVTSSSATQSAVADEMTAVADDRASLPTDQVFENQVVESQVFESQGVRRRPIAHIRRLRPLRDQRAQGRSLVEQIAAGPGDDPGPGGWSGGFATQAHWDPGRERDWRCWAQSGPTWSAHCGAEVTASDTLGLCEEHRVSLLDKQQEACPGAPEHALNED
jgi:hypothetical protein